MKGINEQLDHEINKEVEVNRKLKAEKKLAEMLRPLNRRSIEDIMDQKRLRKEFNID